MCKKYLNKKNNIGGYTIIETMIAISIFLIVIVIGIGSLLNASIVNKSSQNTRSVLDSLNFSMEDISRNIRTGYDYHCLVESEDTSDISTPESCMGISKGGYGISFESSDGDSSDPNDQWSYYVSGGKLFKSISNDLLNDRVQMTPDGVTISSFGYNFLVIGAENTDKQQPLVIIRLTGKILNKDEIVPFSLQTTVSQRKIDN